MPEQPLTITKSEPLTIVSSEPDQQAATPDTSTLGAIGRGLSAVWEQIDPVAAVKGTYKAVTEPVSTIENIGAAHKALYDKAAESFKSGDYVNGAVHGLNMLIPLVGPQIDALAERGASGDTSGMLGGAVGLGLALGGPKAAVAGVKALSKVPSVLPTAVADAADAASTKRIVDVIAPKVGANKAKFVAMAAKAAPALARDPDMMAMSRQGLIENVASKMDKIGSEMDAVNAARPQGLSVPVSQVVADLERQKARYATSIGKVGDPYKGQVEQITQAIKDVQSHGQTITYDDLKTLRQAYDQRGKPKYSPAVTPGYDQVQATAQGAADAASAMRNRMAQMDPAMKGPNADYHLYKGVQDVLRATEETEMGRPTRGREIMARTAASVAGEAAGGVKGAVAGWLVGPFIDSALQSGVTTKIGTARALAQLADAIRAGKTAQVNSTLYRIASMTGKTAQLKALLAGQTLGSVSLPAAAQDQTAAPQ